MSHDDPQTREHNSIPPVAAANTSGGPASIYSRIRRSKPKLAIERGHDQQPYLQYSAHAATSHITTSSKGGLAITISENPAKGIVSSHSGSSSY
jgi:hypothetical protein